MKAEPAHKPLLTMEEPELIEYVTGLCTKVDQGNGVNNEDLSYIYHRIFKDSDKTIDCRSCRISACIELMTHLDEEKRKKEI